MKNFYLIKILDSTYIETIMVSKKFIGWVH